MDTNQVRILSDFSCPQESNKSSQNHTRTEKRIQRDGVMHTMKRIPRIKFPQRHPKHSSGSESKPQVASGAGDAHSFFLGSKVPAAPANAAVGGKASLQPKRTPVSDKEIEAILLGGCS